MTRFLFVLGLTLALALTPTFAQEASGTTAAQDTTVGAAATTPSTGEAAAAPTTGANLADWTCGACKVALKDGKCEKCGEMKYGCDHCKIASAAEGKCACGMDYKALPQ